MPLHTTLHIAYYLPIEVKLFVSLPFIRVYWLYMLTPAILDTTMTTSTGYLR